MENGVTSFLLPLFWYRIQKKIDNKMYINTSKISKILSQMVCKRPFLIELYETSMMNTTAGGFGSVLF